MRTESVCCIRAVYFTFISAVWQAGSPFPQPSERTPRNDEIWYCNIKVVEKAVFCLWCYLSCCVLTPCNDDLSIFSVTCSIFIYDRASFFFPPHFGFITHSFVPYLQLMKKIKRRNILCALSYILHSLVIVWHKPSCFCGMLGLDEFVPTGLHGDCCDSPPQLKPATKAFVVWKLFL